MKYKCLKCGKEFEEEKEANICRDCCDNLPVKIKYYGHTVLEIPVKRYLELTEKHEK